MVTRRPSADDLLVLLEVARSERFSRAAEKLGLNHVTVSRRISALERALGGKVLLRVPGGWELTPLGDRVLAAAERLEDALRILESDTEGPMIKDVVRLSAPDAFSTFVAAPAAAQAHLMHPGISVEIVSAVKRAAQHRSGVDIEVVVGDPRPSSGEVVRLGAYVQGLFASAEYLERHPAPTSLEDLGRHRLVYYIASLLDVGELGTGRRHLPAMRESVTSTNVFAQVAATRAGAGIGLLATFMAGRYDDLVRLLPDEVAVRMDYWLVVRAEALRRPAVAAVVEGLRSAVRAIED